MEIDQQDLMLHKMVQLYKDVYKAVFVRSRAGSSICMYSAIRGAIKGLRWAFLAGLCYHAHTLFWQSGCFGLLRTCSCDEMS